MAVVREENMHTHLTHLTLFLPTSSHRNENGPPQFCEQAQEAICDVWWVLLSKPSLTPALMRSNLAAYGFVTPVGVAIGLGVRNSFQPNDPTTILAIGVLDSLSAGVLLYGALVNLIAKDFLAGQMLDVSHARLSVALLSLFVGAALMSLSGCDLTGNMLISILTVYLSCQSVGHWA